VKGATQRLVVFIASPITNEVEELVQVRYLLISFLSGFYILSNFDAGGQKTQENAG
jgi:hypothetical protein